MQTSKQYWPTNSAGRCNSTSTLSPSRQVQQHQHWLRGHANKQTMMATNTAGGCSSTSTLRPIRLVQQHAHWLRTHANKQLILLDIQPADAAAPALVEKTNKEVHDAAPQPAGSCSSTSIGWRDMEPAHATVSTQPAYARAPALVDKTKVEQRRLL